MTIKDYKCKCGKDDFFFADKGNQKGIYCSHCGKWYKWADKDEQNLSLRYSESEHDHEVVKAYNDGQAFILDKIRAEIKKESEIKTLQLHWGEAMGLNKAIDIIDKYRGDTDGNTKFISAKLPDQIDKQYIEDVFFGRRGK